MRLSHSEQDEAASIARLIAQIDSIDAWRERIGRRVLALFLCTFVFALGLLAWVVKTAHDNPRAPIKPPGPRVDGVLHGAKPASMQPGS